MITITKNSESFLCTVQVAVSQHESYCCYLFHSAKKPTTIPSGDAASKMSAREKKAKKGQVGSLLPNMASLKIQKANKQKTNDKGSVIMFSPKPYTYFNSRPTLQTSISLV